MEPLEGLKQDGCDQSRILVSERDRVHSRVPGIVEGPPPDSVLEVGDEVPGKNQPCPLLVILVRKRLSLSPCHWRTLGQNRLPVRNGAPVRALSGMGSL